MERAGGTAETACRIGRGRYSVKPTHRAMRATRPHRDVDDGKAVVNQVSSRSDTSSSSPVTHQEAHQTCDKRAGRQCRGTERWRRAAGINTATYRVTIPPSCRLRRTPVCSPATHTLRSRDLSASEGDQTVSRPQAHLAGHGPPLDHRNPLRPPLPRQLLPGAVDMAVEVLGSMPSCCAAMTNDIHPALSSSLPSAIPASRAASNNRLAWCAQASCRRRSGLLHPWRCHHGHRG